MRALATAFGSGLLFAVGLALGGMTDPNRILGFLDVTGDWDPSLAMVMVGALTVHVVLYRLIVKRPSPVVESTFRVPTRRDIDLRLVLGSALFGLGWGLAGYCPGPALMSGMTGGLGALVFLAAMLGGMGLFHVVEAALHPDPTPVPVPASSGTASTD